MKQSTPLIKIGCRMIFFLTEPLLEMAYGQQAAKTIIDRPIIVIGPARSGTSLLYSLLANHPDTYAPSKAADHFPHHPFSASLFRRLLAKRNPVYRAVPQTTGGTAGGRFPPSEAVCYWKEHLGSWDGGWANVPYDYFSDEDLDDQTREVLPLDLKKRLFVMQKPRLLVKQPGFSYKIKYLNALFPDAIFVHCLRHPLSNFASMKERQIFHKDLHWGFRIPKRESADCPADVLEAQEFANLYETIQRDIRDIENGPARYVPVRYESLLSAFVPEVKNLFQACALEPPDVLLEHPDWFVHRNNSRRIPNELTPGPEAREILEGLAEDMGYSYSSALAN